MDNLASIQYKSIPYLAKIAELFQVMDREYKQAADHYGFICQGCADNCCQTHFFHHTYLEYFFLRSGFDSISAAEQADLKTTAEAVCRKNAVLSTSNEKIRLMCPLNHKELCRLYAYRPMICRLFGIPHELTKPDLNAEINPGCEEFDRVVLDKPYYRFDRTRFYYQLAGLENEFKQTAQINQRIKMTVAQMLLSY